MGLVLPAMRVSSIRTTSPSFFFLFSLPTSTSFFQNGISRIWPQQRCSMCHSDMGLRCSWHMRPRRSGECDTFALINARWEAHRNWSRGTLPVSIKSWSTATACSTRTWFSYERAPSARTFPQGPRQTCQVRISCRYSSCNHHFCRSHAKYCLICI